MIRLSASAQGVRFVPDGKSVVFRVGTECQFWDISGEEPKRGLIVPDIDHWYSLAPDGKVLACARKSSPNSPVFVELLDIVGNKPRSRCVLTAVPPGRRKDITPTVC